MPNIKVEIVCVDLVYNRYQIARNCTSGVTSWALVKEQHQEASTLRLKPIFITLPMLVLATHT